MLQYSLQELAEHTQSEYRGNPRLLIKGITALEKGEPDKIACLHNQFYKKFLLTTKASAIILTPESAKSTSIPALITENPRVSFAKIGLLFRPEAAATATGIHSTVIIGKNCIIPDSASLGPYTVLGDNIQLGENTRIGSHCVIQNNVIIGENSCLADHVVLYSAVRLGKYVVIQSGTVIGADGFGYANENGKWIKIYQFGTVVIGNHVEIGSNTTIDRGAIENTEIEDDVIIDNQVQIAHNVKIGRGTAIAGCTGIAGSSKIGKHCLIGGAVMINGHIEICDAVQIVGATSVIQSIDKPGLYASPIPALPYKTWLRNAAYFLRLSKRSSIK